MMIIQNESDLAAWQRAWSTFHVVLAMAQLGLFDLMLDGQVRTSDRLAADLNADARAMDICGRILTRAGLLSYQDGFFCLTDAARGLIVPLEELKWLWKRQGNYADLLDVIRTGRPAMMTSGGVLEENEADARQFLTMLHRHSAENVVEAVQVLRRAAEEQPVSGKWRILDLGGGHGRYAAAFAAQLPNAEVTLFDRTLATRIARDLSGDGFTTRNDDFLRDDLGGPYETVFMAFIVSGIALDDVRALFARLRRVVVPNGSLVIEEMFVDPVRNLKPGNAIDFQLTLLLENERGRFRTIPEISGLLSDAGFPDAYHVPVEGQDFSFLVAR